MKNESGVHPSIPPIGRLPPGGPRPGQHRAGDAGDPPEDIPMGCCVCVRRFMPAALAGLLVTAAALAPAAEPAIRFDRDIRPLLS